MYITVKTSKRRVKIHKDTWGDQQKYIKAGTPYIQIHNGGIGRNSHYANYPLDYVNNMIIKARTANLNADYEIIEENKQPKCEAFCADDIPF